jgi:hypothetical protein
MIQLYDCICKNCISCKNNNSFIETKSKINKEFVHSCIGCTECLNCNQCIGINIEYGCHKKNLHIITEPKQIINTNQEQKYEGLTNQELSNQELPDQEPKLLRHTRCKSLPEFNNSLLEEHSNNANHQQNKEDDSNNFGKNDNSPS